MGPRRDVAACATLVVLRRLSASRSSSRRATDGRPFCSTCASPTPPTSRSATSRAGSRSCTLRPWTPRRSVGPTRLLTHPQAAPCKVHTASRVEEHSWPRDLTGADKRLHRASAGGVAALARAAASRGTAARARRARTCSAPATPPGPRTALRRAGWPWTRSAAACTGARLRSTTGSGTRKSRCALHATSATLAAVSWHGRDQCHASALAHRAGRPPTQWSAVTENHDHPSYQAPPARLAAVHPEHRAHHLHHRASAHGRLLPQPRLPAAGAAAHRAHDPARAGAGRARHGTRAAVAARARFQWAVACYEVAAGVRSRLLGTKGRAVDWAALACGR